MDRMLRLRQQFSHAMFHAAMLGTAITLQGTAGGCSAQHLAEAAGSMKVSWDCAQSVLWYQNKSQALLSVPVIKQG